MKHVELTRRAEKDLKQLDKPTRRRIVQALRDQLAAEPPSDNADIKALQGAYPWLRLRIGTYRVLYRPLTLEELAQVSGSEARSDRRPNQGYLIERIVHRRDLDQAAGTL